MNTAPLDIPALVHAVAWPLFSAVLLYVYRRPFSEFVGTLGMRVSKLSLGVVSLELAALTQIDGDLLEAKVRALDSGADSSLAQYPEALTSEVSSIAMLLSKLLQDVRRDFIMFDLGDTRNPRWLSSRLYLTAFLMTLVKKSPVFVFVETVGQFEKCFVGTCSASQVRWALGQHFGWLEAACAIAYSELKQPKQNAENFVAFDDGNPIDSLPQAFVPKVQEQYSNRDHSTDLVGWVHLGGDTYEHAQWLNSAKLKQLLGSDLSVAHAVLPPGKRLDDLASAVIAQKDRYVAIVELNNSFHSLVDRYALLENVST